LLIVPPITEYPVYGKFKRQREEEEEEEEEEEKEKKGRRGKRKTEQSAVFTNVSGFDE
jgi:hypothetical protein